MHQHFSRTIHLLITPSLKFKNKDFFFLSTSIFPYYPNSFFLFSSSHLSSVFSLPFVNIYFKKLRYLTKKIVNIW